MGKEIFQIQEIEDILCKSLTILIEDDLYLIENKTKEESINHRLAIYLEWIFKEMRWPYNIDIEYNKNGEASKSYVQPNKKKRFAVPDIIVHSRGDNENNLLFIETKKLNSNSLDFIKAKAFLHQGYFYKYACLINYLPSANYIVVRILQSKGKEIDINNYRFLKSVCRQDKLDFFG